MPVRGHHGRPPVLARLTPALMNFLAQNPEIDIIATCAAKGATLFKGVLDPSGAIYAALNESRFAG